MKPAYNLDYAPWELRETAIMVPRKLKFPHAFSGHRYIGAGPGVGGGGGLSGGAPGGGEGPGVAAGGSVPGGVVGGIGGTFAPPPPVLNRGAYLAAAASGTPGSETPSGLASGGLQIGFGGFIGGDLGATGLPGGGQLTLRRDRVPMLGRQGGGYYPPLKPPAPQQPVPVLDLTKPCAACGVLETQIGDLRKSIDLEQQQKTVQTVQNAQRTIDEIRDREAQPQDENANLDQQIQEKYQLLDTLTQQLDQEQQRARQNALQQMAQEGGSGPPPPPIPPAPTLGQLALKNYHEFLSELEGAGGCAKTLSLLGIPPVVAGALCLGYQQVKGDVRQLDQWGRQLYDYLVGKQTGPTMPPPAPKVPMEFCVTCESTEDALKYQSGEGSDGCYLVQGSVRHGT